MSTASPARDRVLIWKHLDARAFDRLDRQKTIVTASVSPLEVHGPHLPTMTDNVEAEALVDSAMTMFLERHPDLTALKLPPIFAGADVLPRRGSIAMRSSTLVRVIEDLGRSLARQGFRHIWLSNFHAGPRHIVALETATDRVNRRFGARAISVFSLIVSELARRDRRARSKRSGGRRPRRDSRDLALAALG